MSEPQGSPIKRSLAQRLGWFGLLWLAGVVAVWLVSLVLRAWIAP